jgi:tripartite ATP-independent transporter DctM subunit
MSPELAGALGLIALVILLFARMWIGAAMALVGFVGYAYIMGLKPAFAVISQIPFTTIAWYPMSTVPLFIFMGIILFRSGIGTNLYEMAYSWLGHLRGGLAMATIIACAFFAAITGVSSPAAITMGKVAVPEMRKRHYDDSLATGSIVCAGTLAFLIPPSMAFIIYGILTEQSIGMLFIAGFLPGLLLTTLLLGTTALITIINPTAGPAGPKTGWKERVHSLKGTWHTIILFLIVLGGIYGGVFTPTEAGAIGAFGAIIITAISRRLTLRTLLESLLEAAQTAAMVFLMIIGAYILMKFLAISKLPMMLSETVAALPLHPMIIFAGIIVMYIFLGMFLDIFSAVIMTIPVIYPLVVNLGFDPLWFGVIVVIVCQMGLVTPPVGLDVFVLSGAINVPLNTIFRGVAPYLLAMVICIVLLVLFPQIVLFLPSTM